MRGHEEVELISGLTQILDHEMMLDRAKEVLIENPSFNLQDAFQLFDYHSTGAVSVTDIQDAFNAYGVFPNREEAQFIMNRYDTDGDG